MSNEYVSLEEARSLSGLRLVSIRAVPSPWTQAARTVFFGLAHEICGEMGLGWRRRLQSIAAGMQGERPNPVAVYVA